MDFASVGPGELPADARGSHRPPFEDGEPPSGVAPQDSAVTAGRVVRMPRRGHPDGAPMDAALAHAREAVSQMTYRSENGAETIS